LPIRSPLDERTREGDDHPARLFLRFLTDRGEKRAMEVIWGNRLKPGDYKYIGGFPHFVANAGEDRVGRWLDERIDLARVYAEIWARFARDSPLEGAGFEPSVPLAIEGRAQAWNSSLGVTRRILRA
jgi:hypothetical protein